MNLCPDRLQQGGGAVLEILGSFSSLRKQESGPFSEAFYIVHNQEFKKSAVSAALNVLCVLFFAYSSGY